MSVICQSESRHDKRQRSRLGCGLTTIRTISSGHDLAEGRPRSARTCFVPTVLREGPYRLFFYSGDRNEPPHIHVERDTHRAKFWLDPVRLARSGGFGAAELRELERLVLEHAQLLLGKWNEYFIVTD